MHFDSVETTCFYINHFINIICILFHNGENTLELHVFCSMRTYGQSDQLNSFSISRAKCTCYIFLISYDKRINYGLKRTL